MANQDNRLFRANEIRLIKKAIKLLGTGLGVLVLGVVFLAWYGSHKTPSEPQNTESSFIVDSRILALGNEVGINPKNLSLARAQIGNVPGQPPDSVHELSAFTPGDNVIYIYPILFSHPHDKQVSTLGHEYLHWVWETQVSDKETTCADLMTYYKRPALVARMKPYEKLIPGTLPFCDEIHSILGTEVNDATLNPKLVDYYKKWLPNRNALPSYF